MVILSTFARKKKITGMTSIELDARKANFIRKVLNDIHDEAEMKKLENTMKKVTEMRGRGDIIAPMMQITQTDFDQKIRLAVNDDDMVTEEETTLFYVRWATEK